MSRKRHQGEREHVADATTQTSSAQVLLALAQEPRGSWAGGSFRKATSALWLQSVEFSDIPGTEDQEDGRICAM